MSRSQYGPAAGASGGARPRLAALDVPEYIRLSKGELHALFAMLRDPLVSHVYVLLCTNSVFNTGEFLGGYARLMDLCTPPEPERGRRRKGPTMKQMRRAVQDLVQIGLVLRSDTNQAQGQLRLWIPPRDTRVASKKSEGRVSGRVSEVGKRELERLRASS